MFDRRITVITGRERPTGSDSAGEGRWENEGGAGSVTSGAGTHSTLRRGRAEAATRAASDALDARQDELMTQASSEGRPPPRRQRMIEWRWLGLGAIVIIAGITTWILVRGVSPGAVAVGLTLSLLLVVGGASPVLVAGMLRGREERAARREARLERQEQP